MEPRFSYLFGSSGGGIRGTGLYERFPGLYDEGLFSVAAGTFQFVDFYGTLFDYFSPTLHAKVEDMTEAVGVNGHGDPFSVLASDEERHALRMILTAGLPKMLIPRLTDRFGLSRGRLVGIGMRYDPGYYDEFWERGYGGES